MGGCVLQYKKPGILREGTGLGAPVGPAVGMALGWHQARTWGSVVPFFAPHLLSPALFFIEEEAEVQMG